MTVSLLADSATVAAWPGGLLAALWAVVGGVIQSGVVLLEFFRRNKAWPWEGLVVRGPGRIGPYVLDIGPYFLMMLLQIAASATLIGLTVAALGHVPSIAALVGGAALTFALGRIAQAVPTFSAEEDRVRQNILNEITPRRDIVINVSEGGTVDSISGLIPDAEAVRVSDSMEKQEAILREMYTQGLAQARNSFRVSLTFAVIGALVLLAGIALAIWNAPGTGDQYASIVATTAGIVINLTSSLFFIQSNRARRSMTEQAVLLREESREDRRLSAARELVAAVSDESLRDDVRARLAVMLLSAPVPQEDNSITAAATDPAKE
ncbi:hypothetical protein ACFWPX_03390 [Nocardia sp. NPDC058518]|uniref:TRADD-N-associated membrane domain-containing protein n=1 Tax=Nocardia sp. NPDC058518 TaxID=3346534 RepID=UPI00364DF5C1